MNVQSTVENATDTDDRRAEIVQAARRVFAADGFKGATLKRIAEAAGISPGLVYWYFKDKEALFQSVASSLIDTVLPEPFISQAHAGEAPERILERFAVRYLAIARNVALPLLPILAEVSKHESLRIAILRAVPGRVLRHLSDYLRQLDGDGRLHVSDPDLAAELFMGMLGSQFLLDRIFPGLRPERDSEHVARFIAATFLSGLRSPAAGGEA